MPTQSQVPSHRSPFALYWDAPFFVELLLLALAAPVFYFPVWAAPGPRRALFHLYVADQEKCGSEASPPVR